MGSGAPLRFDIVSANTVATILAHQALMREAEENLAQALKECLSGSENPYYWQQLDKWRGLLVHRNQLYTMAILRLEKNHQQ